MKKKAKGAKDDSEDEDSEDDDLDNLDDDEVSLGSMNEEFAEIEEDGGIETVRYVTDSVCEL